MSRRTAGPASAVPPASASQPFVAADGEAHDAELERRWASVHAGLVAVLDSLEDNDDGRTEAGDEDDEEDASRDEERPAKRRRTSEVNPDAWMTVWVDVHALFQHRDPKKKRRMYERVREFLKGYVRDQLAALRARLGGDGVMLLREYKRRWDKSVQFVKSMKRMLHHLQHFWVPENCNLSKENPIRPLDRLLMFYWREELLAELPEITGIVLGMIDDDRCGKPIDHAPVKAVIDTLVVLGSADANTMHDVTPIPCAPARPGPSILDLHRSFRPPSAGAGSASRRSKFDDAVDFSESLHLYLQVFEDEFLKRTAAFYASEADKMLRGSGVSLFMQDVVGRLDEEIARGQRLLHADSMLRLRSTVEEKLVGAHMQYLQSQADEMVRNGREDDLRMVFQLLERLEGGLGPIRDYLMKFIVEEGMEMMRTRAAEVTSKQDVKKSLAVVDDMVKLHKERTEMIHRCFGGSQIFVKALDDAFNSFMNRPIGSLMMAEVLAYYMDSLLRNPRVSIPTVGTVASSASGAIFAAHRPLSGKELTLTASGATKEIVRHASGSPAAEALAVGRDVPAAGNAASRGPLLKLAVDSSCLDEPIVQQMDRIIRLFMYVDDKDLFHETYRRLLAKRLLNKHDDTLEREFISKLKMQTGAVYTGKISGMFQDVIISNEERQKFRARCEAEDKLSTTDHAFVSWRRSRVAGQAGAIEFSAHVLNALYWPTFQEDHLSIPHPLVQWQRTFGEFYMRNKESRRITWIHSQSTNLVAAQLNGKEYTLHVSTFQACILLEFNKHGRRSLAELSLALNIQPAVLARHMQPLVVSKKSPLFICHGDPSDVESTLSGYSTRDGEIKDSQGIVEPLFQVPKEVRESTNKDGVNGRNDLQKNGAADDADAIAESGENDDGGDIDDDDGSLSMDDADNVGNNDLIAVAMINMMADQHAGVAAAHNADDNNSEDDDGSDSGEAEGANPSGHNPNFETEPPYADLAGVGNDILSAVVQHAGGMNGANSADDDAAAAAVAGHGASTVHVGAAVAPSNGGADNAVVTPSPNLVQQEAADALSLLGNYLAPQGGAEHGAHVAPLSNLQGNDVINTEDAVNGDAGLPGFGPQPEAYAEAEAPAHGFRAQSLEVDEILDGPSSFLPTSSELPSSVHHVDETRPDDISDDDGVAGAISEAEGEGDGGESNGGEKSVDARAQDRVTALKESEGPASTLSTVPAASGKDAAHEIYYELVPNFTSRLLRIQYPAQLARATKQETAVTRQNIVIDRNSLLDATLVRVMKQRKTLPYQQLMAEVLSQVSGTFKPEARAVKDRLEHLIEREFIERSPDDATIYLYAA